MVGMEGAATPELQAAHAGMQAKCYQILGGLFCFFLGHLDFLSCELFISIAQFLPIRLTFFLKKNQFVSCLCILGT